MISIASWAPSSGITLEPNAEKAVKALDGCIALLAGPGAGKTEALAQRADFLLSTGVCSYPRRILAIAFKTDASANLKARVTLRCGHNLASRFDSYTFHAFAKRLIDTFRPVLSGTDTLNENYSVGTQRISKTQITFNDMVPLANAIISQCALARNAIRATYTDVFLDEFQDCTTEQYSLIVNAFKGIHVRVIAVGDTKQTIMGWAGALDGIFAKFGRDFHALPLNLYQNFRSQARIRRVQNRMIQDMDPSAAVPMSQISGVAGVVRHENFDDDSDEAIWIVDRIEEWIGSGVLLSEIAILCNTQPHLYALKIMGELQNRGLAFRNEQEVQDLFCEPLFKLVADFLVILTGKNEPDAWERFHQVVDYYANDDGGDALARAWSKFIQLQQKEIQCTENFDSLWKSVEVMLQRLSAEALRAMSNEYENPHRLGQIAQNIKVELRKCYDHSLEFSETIKALGKSNAVRIMTIHKCKGLEFDAVIVQGVETQTFFGVHDAAQCAFFVAISRAKRALVVTTAEFREKPTGANQHWRESRSPYAQFLSYVTPEVGRGK